MSRSVVSTISYKVWNGLNLVNATNPFIVVGQVSDWENEPTPDDADNTLATPDEPVVAIKPYLITLAVSVTAEAYALLDPSVRSIASVNGVIVYLEHITENDAYDRGATFFLAKSYYDLALGHPAPSTDGFRAYYYCTDVTPATGYEAADYLEPAQVDDYGLLFYVNNGPEIPITGGEFSTDLTVLIELR